MGNAYLAEFYRIHEYRLGNLSFKKVKISKNCKKTSQFYHKTVFYVFHSQNLIKNSRNFESGFFPDFPDPVFSQNFCLERLGTVQLFANFCPLLLHKLYKQFDLVEEGGAHEKCKKHTFFR